MHCESLSFVTSVTTDGLARESWTSGGRPAVTAGARLVSIIDDAAQHLGQAAYIRGIAPANLTRVNPGATCVTGLVRVGS